MRLIEERGLLVLQVVSLFILLISTVFLQIADYKIGKYESECTRKLLVLINKFNVQNTYSMSANFYTLFQTLRSASVENLQEVFKSPQYKYYVNPEEKELTQKLESESITLKDYLAQSAMIKRKKSRELIYEFNIGIDQLKKDIEKGTPWLPVRNFLLVPLQFILISILIIGYSKLIIQISKRTRRKNVKQTRKSNF